MLVQFKVTAEDIKKGKPKETSCPIALCMNRRLKRTDTSVGREETTFNRMRSVSITHSHDIIGFIDDFDGGLEPNPMVFYRYIPDKLLPVELGELE